MSGLTPRRAGKAASARARYEEAKASGEHAHYYGSRGSECSVNCAGFRPGTPTRPVPTVPFR